MHFSTRSRRMAIQSCLFDNIPETALDKYGPLAYTLDGLSKTRLDPSNTRDMIYLFDKEDPAASTHEWRRRVQVKFESSPPTGSVIR